MKTDFWVLAEPRTGENYLGLPNIEPTGLEPDWFKDKRSLFYSDSMTNPVPLNSICNFFGEDRYFENIWSYKERSLSRLKRFAAVCMPDFSVYAEHGIAFAHFQAYRAAWLANYWTENGIKVIPSISINAVSKDYMVLDCLPVNDVYAICHPNMGVQEQWENFIETLYIVIDLLEPKAFLFFGQSAAKHVGKIFPKVPLIVCPRSYEQRRSLFQNYLDEKEQ